MRRPIHIKISRLRGSSAAAARAIDADPGETSYVQVLREAESAAPSAVHSAHMAADLARTAGPAHNAPLLGALAASNDAGLPLAARVAAAAAGSQAPPAIACALAASDTAAHAAAAASAAE